MHRSCTVCPDLPSHTHYELFHNPALCSHLCVSIDIGTELQNWWKAMCSLGLASYSHLFFSRGYLSVFVWFPSRPCLEKKKVLWKVLLLADDSFAFSWFFFFFGSCFFIDDFMLKELINVHEKSVLKGWCNTFQWDVWLVIKAKVSLGQKTS